MDLKKILIVLGCIVLSLQLIAQQKPNVIVVLSDDIGVGDISHYRRMHSESIILETPNIDKLADAGIVFTQAHAPAALCAPSRYGIMTGNSCYRSPYPWGGLGSLPGVAHKRYRLNSWETYEKSWLSHCFFW